MESKAIARFIRQSPRKVRLVADVVRGLSVGVALDQLRVSRKAARLPVAKLLHSAVANAKTRGLDTKALYVKTITVDGGPVLKRARARAFGRSAPIYHRTCHIAVVLAERGGAAVSSAVEAIAAQAPVSANAAAGKPKTVAKKKAVAKKTVKAS